MQWPRFAKKNIKKKVVVRVKVKNMLLFLE